MQSPVKINFQVPSQKFLIFPLTHISLQALLSLPPSQLLKRITCTCCLHLPSVHSLIPPILSCPRIPSNHLSSRHSDFHLANKTILFCSQLLNLPAEFDMDNYAPENFPLRISSKIFWFSPFLPLCLFNFFLQPLFPLPTN